MMLKYRLKLVAVVTTATVVALAACQDRKPPVGSSEYPTPSDASTTSSTHPAAVPGQGADLSAKGTETGMVGGASGTVGSGGKPGSGSTSGAGTGAAVSSDSKVESRK